MNSSHKELPRGVRGRYQFQDSAMTLREGLAEYSAVNPGLNDPSPEFYDRSLRELREEFGVRVIHY